MEEDREERGEKKIGAFEFPLYIDCIWKKAAEGR